MSLFTRSYNKFAGTNDSGLPQNRNEQNITYRKKISSVSTSLQGDDCPVAASPRNCYSRNNVVPLRRRVFDEPDGSAMSTSGQTPVEKRAAEIRRMNSRKESKETTGEENHASPPQASIEGPPSAQTTNQKKPRNSSSSLASVFRSRASSPIERMRKFIGRSSSKQPKEMPPPSPPSTSTTPTPTQIEQLLTDELEKVRSQLAETQFKLAEQTKKMQIQTVSCSQQYDAIPMIHASTMTVQPENGDSYSLKIKQNVGDKENKDPEIVCLDDCEQFRVENLLRQIEFLKKENAEQKEDFRRTRKDFILILKEAVLRKDEAERQFEAISKSISDEDDWITLMSQHRHTLRRNVLLMWVQKKLEPYADQLTVSNFSSDWTDCRAFCALLYDLFPEFMPDVTISPIVGDCVSRCHRTFQHLEIPFDERALGIAKSSPSPDSGAEEDSSSTSSVITGLTDWRYIMNTVFALYKRGVLGK